MCIRKLISSFNTNLSCSFVCGNSSYIWVKQHLKSLYFKQLDDEETLPSVCSTETCTLLTIPIHPTSSDLCFMDLFIGRI